MFTSNQRVVFSVKIYRITLIWWQTEKYFFILELKVLTYASRMKKLLHWRTVTIYGVHRCWVDPIPSKSTSSLPIGQPTDLDKIHLVDMRISSTPWVDLRPNLWLDACSQWFKRKLACHSGAKPYVEVDAKLAPQPKELAVICFKPFVYSYLIFGWRMHLAR